MKEVALMTKGIETAGAGDPTPPQPADQEKLDFSELVSAEELTDLVGWKISECADADCVKSIGTGRQKVTIAILSGAFKEKEVQFAISEWETGGVSVMFTDGVDYTHYTLGVYDSFDERVVIYRVAGGDFSPISRREMDALRDVVSEATPLPPRM